MAPGLPKAEEDKSHFSRATALLLPSTKVGLATDTLSLSSVGHLCNMHTHPMPHAEPVSILKKMLICVFLCILPCGPGIVI